jgi:hypothetical protein
MLKKTLFIFTIFFIFCGTLWAAGNKDNVSRTAEDSSGFTDAVDISGRKPGTYNFYLEARDNAGNIMRAGPDNIFIDPRSDLPQATVVNPLPNLRVQGNMNIVGIAVDDDGVDNVQLSIRRGTNGKGEEIFRAIATGSDFWSYFLDTTDSGIWTDGNYTLTAWAVDINGLPGIAEGFRPRDYKKHDVYWVLDRKRPDIAIQSHSIGELVSGRIRLRGTVNDGNGIKAFAYSTDGGEHYTAVRIRFDRRTNEYTWEINLNTTTLENGPAVIWFQAQDGQGTLGTAAHLLFVNNIGPDVDIVYPPPTATVNGLFSISAFASHPVGLKSVRWSADRQSGEFELLPGNQWFSTAVDLRGIRTNDVTVEIRAEDVSGNVTVKRQRYRVDQNADMPTVTLVSPTPGTAEGGIIVKGTASDDDGVASILYSVNGGTAVEVPSSGYFQFLIPSAPEGSNNLEVWAKDVTGVTGPKVLVRGIVVPPPVVKPHISLVTTGSGNNAVVSDFYTGMRITLQPRVRTVVDYTVNSENIASASIVFGNLPPVTVRPAGSRGAPQKASVQIPDTLASGFTKIELRLTDRQGREIVFTEYANISNPSVPASSSQSGLVWVRPNELSDGIMVLGSADEKLMGLDGSGESFTSATLQGTGSEYLYAEIDRYGRLSLSALSEGNFGPLAVYLAREDGVAYQSEYFNVVAAYSGPRITINQFPDGWLQNSASVSFNVYSENRIASVAYSMDMGVSWTDILTSQEIASLRTPVNANITRNIDISDVEDGSINLQIRAVNEAGLESVSNLTVLKDTKAPQAELVMPIAEARVNGTIRLAFAINEHGSLKTVSYRMPAAARAQERSVEVFNAAAWNRDYSPMFLEVLMDSLQMPLDENMVFVFEDMAGNSSELNAWAFIIDQEMDIPVVQLSLPLEDEVITADFIVSGVMFDDDAIRQVYWKIDNGGEQIITAQNGFSIPIQLAGLTDNEHTVTITAEDIYGVKSEPVTRQFKVSLAEPVAAVISPLYDKVLRDVVEIKGTAVDNNGISHVLVSVDNGNTYNRVYGTGWYIEGQQSTRRRDTEWNYQFNTIILEDGPHVVFIRVFDGLGVSSTFASMINIDNTPPEIVLDSPGDGSVSVGSVSVMGRTLDPNLASVVLELRSLEGAQISPDMRARSQRVDAVLRDTLDLRSHVDGLYNVTVVATDAAGNVTRTSRNFELTRTTIQNYIEILYPLDNEEVSGEFNMYGITGGPDKAGSVTIRINEVDVQTSEVDDAGFFRFNLGRENFAAGENKVTVRSSFGGERTVQSRENNVFYNTDGPWVTIDSFSFGDYAYERPYLYGRTGYILSEEDAALLADRSTERTVRDAIRAKRVDYTEISFDNGVTYYRTGPGRSRGSNYSYRLETGDMIEGMHYILVRTTMKNGEVAVTRMLVQVDKTPPVIRLISPEAGGRYNEQIRYSASATDDVELNSLTYHLRVGNKSAYEIPGFLQGLYLEGIIPPFIKQLVPETPNIFAGGATYMDFGFGLSFFDDNVKVQVQYGTMTNDQWVSLGGSDGEVRYGGQVLGLKLLANIYQLPFGAFAGPDWEWLSMSFALGANFSLFDIGQEGYTQSGTPTWMSALLLQIEFPKVTIPKWKYLRKFALFTEGQLWFVPTDVDAAANNIPTIIPHIIMGFRLYIF